MRRVLVVWPRPKYWLHALLLLCTFATTTVVGAWLQYDFDNNLPSYNAQDLDFIAGFVTDPARLASGLPFSVSLLVILLAHEMGHYFACRYYRVDATLPFFLPAPTPIGTLGAFIRIRSPIGSLRELFDIGVSGPIAGFVFVAPLMAIGLALGKVLPGIREEGGLIPGRPALEYLLAAAIFPGVSADDIYPHPVARAAWVGALATALNLFPIGQLDGGHILYSFSRRLHRRLSLILIGVLILLGWRYSPSWLVWAALLAVFALRHPSVFDTRPLGRGRRWLGLFAAVMLALTFCLVPIREGAGLQ
ncbi:MAG: site-2 protease family protein [Bryobacteraceae bacterium]